MKFSDLCRDIFSGRPINRLPTTAHSAPRRILGPKDITTRIAPAEDLDIVEGPESGSRNRLELQQGDIVVTSRGAVRAAVASEEHAGVLVGANLVVVRPHLKVGPHLIAAYLRHPAIQEHLLAEYSGSATPGFSIETLKQLDIQYPKDSILSDLQRIASTVESYAENLEDAASLRRRAVVEMVFENMSPLASESE